MSHAAATSCMNVPMSETRLAASRSRNTRCLSGRHGLEEGRGGAGSAMNAVNGRRTANYGLFTECLRSSLQATANSGMVLASIASRSRGSV
jgi:hypothetical protein